jgi:dethiobiotin synthase
MRRGVFVTGTDTGVGKTVVCAALLQRYRREMPLGYWKPVQTGIEQDDDTAVVRDLGECAAEEIFDQGVRLQNPVSPHLAARLSGTTISLPDLATLAKARAPDRTWIIEGAGGALVPLNDKDLMTDWMARLSIPALVVARSALGTINHTLLTLEALHRRSVDVVGVVMVGEPNEENRMAIEHYGGTPVLGEMPSFPELTAVAVGSWARKELDPHSRLWQHSP